MTTAETAAPIEVVEPDRALVRVAEENGLAETSAAALIEKFRPHFAEAHALIEEAKAVVVTDATQVSEIKRSRDLRLKLREVRVAAEKDRKALKENSLRVGKAIDGMNNVLLLAIQPAEDRLMEQEKFAERKEAERKARVRAAREDLLRPYGVDTQFVNLADMPEPQFAEMLNGAKAAHEARLAAEKKAEEERIAAENARLAEEARVREENERLRREAEERETEIRREREAAEAKALEEARARQAEADRLAQEHNQRVAAEREKARKEQEAAQAKLAEERRAREKAEAELQAKKDAEDKRRKAEERAAKRAAAAPDKVKLTTFAAAVRALPLPAVTSPDGLRIRAIIETWIKDGSAHIERMAREIGEKD